MLAVMILTLGVQTAWAQGGVSTDYYTLTLVDNYDGGGSRTISNIAPGTNFTLISQLTPSRNGGYFFYFWADTPAPTPDTHYYPEGATITVNSNVTLYAMWNPCGMCGTNVAWAMTKSAGSSNYDVLTISGTGAMDDYGNLSNSLAPWINDFASTIKTVVIDDGVTHIGGCSLYGCNILTSVTIPTSVTSIGDHTFYDCNHLTSVTIPPSVTSIGSGAFQYCSSLTSVTVYATAVPTLGKIVFDRNKSERKIYVFSDRVSAYKSAYNWDGYANDIEPITLGVNDAGENGKWCSYCNDLADVTVADGTTVYKAKMNDAKDMVTLSETGSRIIKRGEAVLLKSSDSIVLESAASSGDGDYTDNDLRGGATVADGCDVYTLATVGGVMGFYKFTGAALNPNRAHLEIPQSSPAPVRGFIGLGGGDGTTGIVTMDYTDADDAWFTLDGRKLDGRPIQKGIYVNGGRKVLIK